MSRLNEQIAEAEAAHQAAKAARNEAQDKRKEAWKQETELKDQVNKATADYDRAFSVSVTVDQPQSPAVLRAVRKAGGGPHQFRVVSNAPAQYLRSTAWAHMHTRLLGVVVGVLFPSTGLAVGCAP